MKIMVELVCEQTAKILLDVEDPDIDQRELVQLALQKLDESHDAGWESDCHENFYYDYDPEKGLVL